MTAENAEDTSEADVVIGSVALSAFSIITRIIVQWNRLTQANAAAYRGGGYVYRVVENEQTA